MIDQPRIDRETLRAELQGYRCPTCDHEFYVGGNEEAHACPVCRNETIWEMVGPFRLATPPVDPPFDHPSPLPADGLIDPQDG